MGQGNQGEEDAAPAFRLLTVWDQRLRFKDVCKSCINGAKSCCGAVSKVSSEYRGGRNLAREPRISQGLTKELAFGDVPGVVGGFVCFLFVVFVLATPAACEISWTRDQTYTTAVTQKLLQ